MIKPGVYLDLHELEMWRGGHSKENLLPIELYGEITGDALYCGVNGVEEPVCRVTGPDETTAYLCSYEELIEALIMFYEAREET